MIPDWLCVIISAFACVVAYVAYEMTRNILRDRRQARERNRIRECERRARWERRNGHYFYAEVWEMRAEKHRQMWWKGLTVKK